MAKTHKDLPGGSQDWAAEVDKGLTKIAELEGIIRQLAANAGIDMSNPKRGINAGNTPSIKNPVGQKLSSLADTDTYNVLDGQVLTWGQDGQKWLPVTLPTPSAGGTIDISTLSYSGLTEGYGEIVDSTHYSYTAAGVYPNAVGPDFQYTETWTTGVAYFGAGDFDTGTTQWTLITLDKDGTGRPFIQLDAYDDASGLWASAILSAYKFRLENAVFVADRCSTATRPTWLSTGEQDRGAIIFDTDLNLHISWDGTQWTNLIGTAV